MKNIIFARLRVQCNSNISLWIRNKFPTSGRCEQCRAHLLDVRTTAIVISSPSRYIIFFFFFFSLSRAIQRDRFLQIIKPRYFIERYRRRGDKRSPPAIFFCFIASHPLFPPCRPYKSLRSSSLISARVLAAQIIPRRFLRPLCSACDRANIRIRHSESVRAFVANRIFPSTRGRSRVTLGEDHFSHGSS
ncbi:hypothetical protein PUN28_015818 [Cardiocondyla obscurior]|uniref:Uncharacterized protein n=1 Tax=Cardiocondyla obscurior TaxID=286306 RepID=A0AAW2ETL1_9HYME